MGLDWNISADKRTQLVETRGCPPGGAPSIHAHLAAHSSSRATMSARLVMSGKYCLRIKPIERMMYRSTVTVWKNAGMDVHIRS